ncbi:MAG: methyltransferase domain-containing protein [Pseudomonas sp.]|uniref:class I SAM-dependent methyltransferase n=1 Tax=Pseudomonas abieticivorans TaxID=2931382 RepID=UPI0020C0FB91|nr:class I SAM-dependent methyltransferase [Pseudomonas sp. PIA16]MDE1169404.1 methyltransferase domain-containing protein [Pseudomonas sp.]
MANIHQAAQQGFGSEAKTYAKGRPDYPAPLTGWLTTTLGVSPGRQVVDLGAGTGKFTQLLTTTGADIVAVEPIDAMRAELVQRLPDVQALAGTAQAIPLADGSADALVCAQAFHWFATAPALAEIHRVLKPGGRLGLVWNVRDESVDWVAAITAIITPYEGDTPRFHTGAWRLPFAGSGFAEPTLATFSYAHVGSAQEVILDRFLSVSFIAALPADEKAKVAAQLQALIDSHPALRGQTSIAFPYRTEAYCALRKD